MSPAPTTAATTALDPSLATEEFLEGVPREFAREHLLLSQGRDGARERLAVSDSSSPLAVFNVGTCLGRELVPFECDGESIVQAIDVAYGDRQSKAGGQPGEPQEEAPSPEDVDLLLAQADQDLLSTQGKRHMVRLVDAILFDAVMREASDVHIQPAPKKTLVRYRVDGRLHTRRVISPHLTAAMVSRIKVMGGMDIAERREAQDGRTTVRIGSRSIDLRISSFPTRHGERVVLRLLDTSLREFDLGHLGMPDAMQASFVTRAQRPHGLILVTGPTGSGKTTTLYATLMEVATPELNIMTIEDPIEYELATLGLSVSQSQINLKKGVTFAKGLRHLLRQDPDVLLVGEIRDLETARMAIQASLTGHLVLSTLHTNDAVSAVTRMTDLGVESFLLGASLQAVLAQRLLRTVHPVCEGTGCAVCYHTGYLGRTGVFELLLMDERLQSLVTRGAATDELRRAAQEGGFEQLQQAGEALVQEGVTTAEEVARVVLSDS